MYLLCLDETAHTVGQEITIVPSAVPACKPVCREWMHVRRRVSGRVDQHHRHSRPALGLRGQTGVGETSGFEQRINDDIQ